MVKKLRTYLFRGLLILLPAGATFLLFYKLYQLLDLIILAHIQTILAGIGVPSFPFQSLITLAVLVVGVGLFGGNFIGRKLIDLTNFLINKIPLIRIIYATIQQMLESVLREKKNAFSKVALIQYPRKGMYSLAFITAETKGPVKDAAGEELWSVFLPTTPNPTSGFLLFVPKSETTLLDLTIDEAAKMIMSAGVIDEKTQLSNHPPLNIKRLAVWFKRKSGEGPEGSGVQSPR